MWKPSLKRRTWRWRVVSRLLTGTAASSRLPAPCSSLGDWSEPGRQLPFGERAGRIQASPGRVSPLGPPLFQAIFKPHVSTSAFALQMCF